MRRLHKIWSFSFAITIVSLIFTSSCKKDTLNEGIPVTDIDGNIYHTVQIGNQLWTVENLITTRYRNGDPISYISDSVQWNMLLTGAYSKSNAVLQLWPGEIVHPTVGNIYNWYAVTDSRNIAPVGWHVATLSDWVTLYAFWGQIALVAVPKLEATDGSWPATYSLNPFTNKQIQDPLPNNESGFTAIKDGALGAYWWGIDEGNFSNFNSFGIGYLNFGSRYIEKTYGLAVRCVKD